jgi:hypothetical protein
MHPSAKLHSCHIATKLIWLHMYNIEMSRVLIISCFKLLEVPEVSHYLTGRVREHSDSSADLEVHMIAASIKATKEITRL